MKTTTADFNLLNIKKEVFLPKLQKIPGDLVPSIDISGDIIPRLEISEEIYLSRISESYHSDVSKKYSDVKYDKLYFVYRL